MFPPNIEFKMFCSWPGENGGNCTREAVGEIPIYLSNNPKGDGIMHMPICQFHLEGLDKPSEV